MIVGWTGANSWRRCSSVPRTLSSPRAPTARVLPVHCARRGLRDSLKRGIWIRPWRWRASTRRKVAPCCYRQARPVSISSTTMPIAADTLPSSPVSADMRWSASKGLVSADAMPRRGRSRIGASPSSTGLRHRDAGSSQRRLSWQVHYLLSHHHHRSPKQIQEPNAMSPHAEIRIDDLRGPEIAALLQEHLDDMALHSPPESIHALDLEKLRRPEITFWTVWQGGELMGCGAIKELDATHGEIKSMRTSMNHRRKGVAALMLRHILDEAKRRGYRRLSLE